MTIDDVESKLNLSLKNQMLSTLTDNVWSGIEDLIQAAIQSVLIVAGAASYVGKGAIAGLGLNYYDVNCSNCWLIAAILEDKKAWKVEWKQRRAHSLSSIWMRLVNWGVTLPQSVIDRAIVSR